MLIEDVLKKTSTMFKPNKNLLKFIGHQKQSGDEKTSSMAMLELPTFKRDYADWAYVMAMVLDSMNEYFKDIFFDNDEIKGKYNQIIGGELLNEMLYNANDWGNCNDPAKKINLGIWFGPKGILLAIRDEGSFFKNPKTKRLIESRGNIPSTRLPVGAGGDGLSEIYESADKIFVSTSENALYVAVLVKSD